MVSEKFLVDVLSVMILSMAHDLEVFLVSSALSMLLLMLSRVSRYWTVQWKLLLRAHGVLWVVLCEGVQASLAGKSFRFSYLTHCRGIL